MSFILDALRKSEHQRQKQAGPALAELPAAVPKQASNPWATGAIVLLLVNLLVIGFMLLRNSGSESPEQATVETRHEAADANEAPVPPGPGVSRAPPPPMLRPAEERPGSRPESSSLRDQIAPPEPPQPEPAMAGTPPGGPAIVRRSAPTGGSVTYQTLEEVDPGYSNPDTSPEKALPRIDEMSTLGGLPDLQLQLHVYSTVPKDRFVFINGQKYKDGDTLQEGPLVEQITSDGVILSMNGHRFVLSSD